MVLTLASNSSSAARSLICEDLVQHTHRIVLWTDGMPIYPQAAQRWLINSSPNMDLRQVEHFIERLSLLEKPIVREDSAPITRFALTPNTHNFAFELLRTRTDMPVEVSSHAKRLSKARGIRGELLAMLRNPQAQVLVTPYQPGRAKNFEVITHDARGRKIKVVAELKWEDHAVPKIVIVTVYPLNYDELKAQILARATQLNLTADQIQATIDEAIGTEHKLVANGKRTDPVQLWHRLVRASGSSRNAKEMSDLVLDFMKEHSSTAFDAIQGFFPPPEASAASN